MKVMATNPLNYSQKANNNLNISQQNTAFGIKGIFESREQRILTAVILRNGGTQNEAANVIQGILECIKPENIDAIFKERMIFLKDRIQKIFPEKDFEEITPQDLINNYDNVKLKLKYSNRDQELFKMFHRKPDSYVNEVKDRLLDFVDNTLYLMLTRKEKIRALNAKRSHPLNVAIKPNSP